MADLICRIAERTMRSNEELVAAVVRSQRDAAELEGYAAGRAARPELTEAVGVAARAVTDRLAAATQPSGADLLRRAAGDPAALKAAWAGLSDAEKAGLTQALLGAIGDS